MIQFRECPGCGGYGIRDSGATCKKCGGSGELMFDENYNPVTRRDLIKKHNKEVQAKEKNNELF